MAVPGLQLGDDRRELRAGAERRTRTPCAGRRRSPARRGRSRPSARSGSGCGGSRGTCRRASRRARRRLPTHTLRRIAAASEASRLLVPSLNPIRFRPVRPSGAESNPACDQRAVATPRPIRASVRTAWNATWGSSAQAWTPMSPPLRTASRRSPRNAGRSARASGRRARSPNRPSKSDGPRPIVTVRRDAGRPYASPVSTGADAGSPPTGPTGSPSHIRAAASDQARRSPARSARDPADVEAREAEVGLGRRRDAALVAAVERDPACVPRRRARRRDRRRHGAARGQSGAREQTSSGRTHTGDFTPSAGA